MRPTTERLAEGREDMHGGSCSGEEKLLTRGEPSSKKI